MDFREFLRQGFVVLDGATGSNLQQAGMESGELSGAVDCKTSGSVY